MIHDLAAGQADHLEEAGTVLDRQGLNVVGMIEDYDLRKEFILVRIVPRKLLRLTSLRRTYFRPIRTRDLIIF